MRALLLSILIASGIFGARADDFFALCATGTPQAVQAALAAGVRVTATNEHGATPLFSAAMAGNAEVVSVLLRGGADLHVKDDLGLSALEYAVRGAGNREVVLRLAAAKLGIDPKELRLPDQAAVKRDREARAAFDSGLWWARRGDVASYQRALVEFEQARSLSYGSRWPELHYNLGLVHLKLGQYQEAGWRFDNYLKEAPQAADAAAVSDLKAQVGYLTEKERRKANLTGAWFDGKFSLHLTAFNLRYDDTNLTADVFTQVEAFQGVRASNIKLERVPVQQNGSRLTLAFDQKVVPSTNPNLKDQPYWKYWHRSYPFYYQFRQVTPRTLEGVSVWGKGDPSRVIFRKHSDTPSENLPYVNGILPEITWIDRLWLVFVRSGSRMYLMKGLAAVETAESPVDYEIAVRYFQQAALCDETSPAPRYNLAVTAEMLGTKAAYTNALAHLDQYLALPVSEAEKGEAKTIRDRIAGKLGQLADRRTLAGIWVPKLYDSDHDQPRLEISKGVAGRFQARALGGKGTEHMMAKGPWVPLTGEPDLVVENARYYTQHKSASPDGGPVAVSFRLERIAEDQLTGTVIQISKDHANIGRTIQTTNTWVFERTGVPR